MKHYFIFKDAVDDPESHVFFTECLKGTFFYNHPVFFYHIGD
jgi:hypothetical protein